MSENDRFFVEVKAMDIYDKSKYMFFDYDKKNSGVITGGLVKVEYLPTKRSRKYRIIVFFPSDIKKTNIPFINKLLKK